MDLESLSRDDDLLCDLLVDNLDFFFRTVKMANDYRPSRAKSDKILEIVRKHIIRKGRVSDAVEEILQVEQVKQYLMKKTPKQISDFAVHARRYLQLYLPQAGYELSSTERYTGTLVGSNKAPVTSTDNKEACVVAVRDFEPGETLKYCTGSIATLSHDQEAALRSSNKDFSVIWSGRKGRMCLFLGPARFVNHDCDSNCEFISYGVNGISFRAVKPIKVGQEVTSFYGENYFGEGNKECMCATCERRQRGAFADPNRQPSEQSSVNSINGDDEDDNPLGLPRRRQSRRTPRLSDKAKNAEAQKSLKVSRGMKRKRSRKGSMSVDDIMSDGSLSDAPSDYESLSFLQSATSHATLAKDRLSDSTHSSESLKREILSDKADDEAISAGSLTPSSLHAAAARLTPPPKEMPSHSFSQVATGSPISLGPNRPPPAHRRTVTCTVCGNNFAPPEEWWTPTMCPRCDRHMKIFDTKWPERRQEGDADLVDSDDEEKVPTKTTAKKSRKLSPKPMSLFQKTHHTHKRSASSSSHKKEDSRLQRRGSAPTMTDVRLEQRDEVRPEPRPPTMSVYESFNAITAAAAAAGGSPTAGRSLRSRGDKLGATTPTTPPTTTTTLPSTPTFAVPDNTRPEAKGDKVMQKAKSEKRKEGRHEVKGEASIETSATEDTSVKTERVETDESNGKSHNTQNDMGAITKDVKDTAEIDSRATRKLRAKKKLGRDMTPTPAVAQRKAKAALRETQQSTLRSSPNVFVDVPVTGQKVNVQTREVKASASLQRTWGDEDHKSLPSIHEATGGVLNMIKIQQERTCPSRDEGMGAHSLLPLPEVGRIRYDRSVLDVFGRAIPSGPNMALQTALPVQNGVPVHHSPTTMPMQPAQTQTQVSTRTQKQTQNQIPTQTHSPLAPTIASARPAEDSAAAEILLALSHGMQ